MLPKSTLLAALSATASASITLVNVVHIVDNLEVSGTTVHDLLEGYSANNKSPRAVFDKRATKEECTASLSSLVATVPTPAPDVLEFLEAEALTGDACSIVAPSSLSSGLLSYMTAALDWLVEEMNVAVDIATRCPDLAGEGEPVAIPTCATGGTFYFTEASATVTVAATDAFADWVPPTPKRVEDSDSDSDTSSGSNSGGSSNSNGNSDSAASVAGVSLSALAIVGALGVAISL
ncbi:hypothetical protein F5X68DRAFT_209462 [Plectosphaerella plurivora]|uniref:Infection structure specific protein n=1 Tax=Plectosphaerella plurivora TaxID=936078 RepID=A0A9P8VA55_9PEZI|nr:hypothetical protein F5X68DRAFT_209462 [Plectosphaerella plurivora]